MAGLTGLPAHQLARLLGAGAVSATEVTAAHLGRLAEVNPRIDALVQPAPDAMDRARQADAALAMGDRVGPLHGAEVAAGGSPCGLGTDSGGSLRVPAHFCGVATLKPTNGLVRVTGVVDDEGPIGALTGPRTQVGPEARTVEDLALLLGVLAGPDGHDAGAVPVPVGRPGRGRCRGPAGGGARRVRAGRADPGDHRHGCVRGPCAGRGRRRRHGGSSPEGLVIAVQLVARPWRDDLALAPAGRLEAALGAWRPPPA